MWFHPGPPDWVNRSHAIVALGSSCRPSPVSRWRGARLHQVSEVLGADEVLEEAAPFPWFAVAAPRRPGEDQVAGLAAVSTSCSAAAAAEDDGISRAAAGLADLAAERPGRRDEPATVLGGAAGGLANRLEQQPSVGGPTLETGAVAVGDSYCRRDEASPAGYRFTLPAASVVCWSLACSSTQVSSTGA